MDDHISLSVTIPADDDGFVRQECPSCGREFKAPIEEDELVTPEHCPYCGHQDEQWFTAEQMEQFEAQAVAAFMPQLEKELKNMAGDVNRAGGGLIKMSLDVPEIDVPVMAPEAPDMKSVVSPCCDASVKMDEDWSGSTFCPQCGLEYQI